MPTNEVARRFRRSAGSYASAAGVQREMARLLTELILLATGRRDFPTILEFGCGGGLLTGELAGRFSYDELVLNDLVPECGALAARFPHCRFLPGDAEEAPLPEHPSLAAANAVFQWLRRPETLFRKLGERMTEGDVLAFSVFGPRNFCEISELTGRGLHYPSPPVWRQRLEPWFEPAAAREELCVLEFPSASAVLRHLRETGVTAPGAGMRWTRGRLAEFEEGYRQRFGTPSGGVTLTYHPVLLVGIRRPSGR